MNEIETTKINEEESQLNVIEFTAMQLIIHAGDAKAHAYEALRKVNEGDYQEAEAEMKLAHKALNTAHNAQTSMLQKEASGEKIDLTILFIHAQDHLMTAITEINLIEQIIELRKVVNALSKDKDRI